MFQTLINDILSSAYIDVHHNLRHLHTECNDTRTVQNDSFCFVVYMEECFQRCFISEVTLDNLHVLWNVLNCRIVRQYKCTYTFVLIQQLSAYFASKVSCRTGYQISSFLVRFLIMMIPPDI